MKNYSDHSAEIGNYQPQDTSGPARLVPFIGEPYVFVKTKSPRWVPYVGKVPDLSVLLFRTPDGPVLVMSFRHQECFAFIVCDFAEPVVGRMLDSWREHGGLQIQMVLGNRLVRSIAPARDLEIYELDRFREEVKGHDELAFVRSVAFLRETGVLEEYAAQEAKKRYGQSSKKSVVIEVNMLYTERFVDATIAYCEQCRPELLAAAQSTPTM